MPSHADWGRLDPRFRLDDSVWRGLPAYDDHGYRVRGAALAGKAAGGLALEAGIEARTLASYDLAWRQGPDTLTSRDVLLIDEAGMVDVRLMARVLMHAERRGGSDLQSPRTRRQERVLRSLRSRPRAADR